MLGRPRVVSTFERKPLERAPPSREEWDFLETFPARGASAQNPQNPQQAQKRGLFSSIRKFLGF